jgi:hypothetical protein
MRGQAQLLRFYDLGNTTQERWQSYWSGQVSFDSQDWDEVQFDAPALTDGEPGAERNISIVMPATQKVVRTIEQALAAGWLAQLRMYEFDTVAGASGPPSGMTLIAQFDGQAVKARATATSFLLDLGTALAPVGATVPPRILTTGNMGIGARL